MTVEIFMRRFIVCLFAGSASVFAAGNPVNPDACELVPLPAPVSFSSDMDAPVDFSSAAEVVVEVPDPAAVEWLNRRFADWYGKHAPRAVSGKTGLALMPGDEAYAVRADGGGVKIAARRLEGVRWAAYSIRQLAVARRGTFRTEGRILPSCTISDAPHLGFRCVHLCWFPEIRKEQIERAVRLAALMKFNYVIIDPWGMYKSERHPWWSWPQAKMTKPEVRRLVAIGRELGVTLIPQIASFGHAGAGRSCTLKHSVLDLQPEYEPLYEPGGWNWCLTNPEAQRVIRELIAEMLADFGHPPFIHLGCDEAQPPTCPECRKRPYGEIVCDHVVNLARYVESRGARAMIWHDMLLDCTEPRWKHFIACGSATTAKLVESLPKSVIICDWQYSDFKDDTLQTWPTSAHFIEKGFATVASPWMNFKAMGHFAAFMAKRGGFGYIQTTWHHLRGDDWMRFFRYGSSSAWGSAVRGVTPQYDIAFANALRMVGHDMKVSDYRDTGHVEYQIPPSWWIDN